MTACIGLSIHRFNDPLIREFHWTDGSLLQWIDTGDLQ